MTSIQDTVEFVNSTLSSISSLLSKAPGSAIAARYIHSSYQNDPVRSVLELALFLFAIRYFLASKYSYNRRNYVELSEEDVEYLVKDWQPDPLAVEPSESQMVIEDEIPVLTGPSGPNTTLLGGETVKDLATANFLDLSQNKRIIEACSETISLCGVGACSPPGFYGIQKVHMEAESKIAGHFGVDSCILYAQAFCTPSSVIPSFSKRGDIIVVDRGINVAIQKALQLSRSTLRWYAHNDMQDLDSVLQKLEEEFEEESSSVRKFIVTEGLFENHGDSPCLEDLIRLRGKYKYRIVLDETWSFGVLGKTGKGLTEEQGADVSKIDVITGSLSHCIPGNGGFCVGSKDVIAPQRLASLGYVFSAALPPYFGRCVTETIDIFDEQAHTKNAGQSLFHKLRENSAVFKRIISTSKYIDTSAPTCDTPLIILRIKSDLTSKIPGGYYGHLEFLQSILEECLKKDILIAINHHVPGQEYSQPNPSLKICVKCYWSPSEIETMANQVKQIIEQVVESDLINAS